MQATMRLFLNIFVSATFFVLSFSSTAIYALGAWSQGLGKLGFRSQNTFSLQRHLLFFTHYCQQAHTMAEAIAGLRLFYTSTI